MHVKFYYYQKNLVLTDVSLLYFSFPDQKDPSGGTVQGIILKLSESFCKVCCSISRGYNKNCLLKFCDDVYICE